MRMLRDSGRGTQRRTRRVMAQLRSQRAGRGVLMAGVAGVVVFAAVVFAAVMVSGAHRPAAGGAARLDHPAATVAVGTENAPPWPAPSDASATADAAGLPMARMEGTIEHIHAHLDVLIDGQPVPVPANIGVDTRRGTMTALHTHDTSGLIHIESPVARPFSLGELFTEWDLSLAADHIGGLRTGGGKQLRVLVNGVVHPGNPAAITIGAHDQIAVVYGVPQPGEAIPASYPFPAGQ
ncbi:Uncharacterised protein [Mycobacteroides abscessus subsp. abscessus]|nr:hypothetical protein [Mycobacteroides abscessus]SHV02558.1 Uncharacterised protein [Mycobacteroides abscessus subsp. abscessus]CPT96399.1 Uncharacterised protein [Mycobacteroides abscessus]CPX11754.1 Uncharacterised protein [Mycobacteroides abscessus]CPZ96304.1 Uncharacterised protein [Mycobacteroides abscessus]